MKNFSQVCALVGGAMLLGVTACKPHEEAALSAPKVALQKVTVGPLPQVIEVTGQLEGPREVEVRARVTGILLQQTYQEGAPVREGQVLFQIDPVPYQIAVNLARAELAQAEAQVGLTAAEARRQEGLQKKKIGSTKEVQDAQAAAKTAAANRDLAKAKLNAAELDLSYCKVVAPINGFAGRIVHSEGSLVTPGADGLLTTVVQRDKVWVRFGLSEEQFKRLFEADAAKARQAKIELMTSRGEIYPVVGKVNYVAAEVEPQLGTIQMRAEFDNSQGGLLPGQYIKVRVAGRTLSGMVRIPAEVILQSTKGPFVFVADEKNQTTLKFIQIDEVLDGQATVMTGLNTGDRVILDNLQRVRSGMIVEPRETTNETK
jgi:membrane fusion protein (multidrug efflux system)